MNIKIYEYAEKGNLPMYAPHSWSTDILKTKVRVFISGQGWMNWPKKMIVEHEEECPNTFTYAECRRLYDTYGFVIAEHYVEECGITCDASAGAYVCIARGVTEAGDLDMVQDLFKFNIRANTGRLICLGVFCFPICELDEHFHKQFGYEEEKHGSMSDFITEKWGPEICEKVEKLIK
jgi:hypothetical protein